MKGIRDREIYLTCLFFDTFRFDYLSDTVPISYACMCAADRFETKAWSLAIATRRPCVDVIGGPQAQCFHFRCDTMYKSCSDVSLWMCERRGRYIRKNGGDYRAGLFHSADWVYMRFILPCQCCRVGMSTNDFILSQIFLLKKTRIFILGIFIYYYTCKKNDYIFMVKI